jgi:hypothetical protein
MSEPLHQQDYSAEAINDLTDAARLDLAIALELVNPEGHNPADTIRLILLTFFGHQVATGAVGGAGAGAGASAG